MLTSFSNGTLNFGAIEDNIRRALPLCRTYAAVKEGLVSWHLDTTSPVWSLTLGNEERKHFHFRGIYLYSRGHQLSLSPDQYVSTAGSRWHRSPFAGGVRVNTLVEPYAFHSASAQGYNWFKLHFMEPQPIDEVRILLRRENPVLVFRSVSLFLTADVACGVDASRRTAPGLRRSLRQDIERECELLTGESSPAARTVGYLMSRLHYPESDAIPWPQELGALKDLGVNVEQLCDFLNASFLQAQSKKLLPDGSLISVEG